MTRLQRTPYLVLHKEQTPLKEVYGSSDGTVVVECMRIVPEGLPSKMAIVFSHPIGGGAFLPLVNALARAGHHVIYANTRYRGNDTALIMEKCVADLGACLRDARKRFGYEQLVLGGWSGGGSLSLFYQDQAEAPHLTHTPAGDPYDLTQMDLLPADGIMLLAAHVSRAATLTEWMDPSITDESKPFERQRDLNIYDPDNPNKPPYDDAYVERYRSAQRDRNHRITSWVRDQLRALTLSGTPQAERAFCVHGTMADLRWTDPTQDPSDRRPYTCYLGEPVLANDGPVGLSRFTTLRSWMSQWSLEASAAHGEKNAERISCPVLVLNNTADLACTPSHARRLFNAVGHDRKELHHVQGADHYYIERADLLPEAVDICSDWLRRQGFC